MVKVYRTRCIVRKDKKDFKKGSIMENLTEAEIEQGLAHGWLEEIGSKDEPVEVKEDKPKDAEKPPAKVTPSTRRTSGSRKTDRETLLKKAEELGLDVADEATDEEIQQLITEAEAGAQ